MQSQVMQEEKLKEVPEYKGKPIVGTGLEFKADPLNYMKRLHERFGDIVKTKLGKREAIFLFKPDYVKYVLATNNSNYQKGSNYKFVNEVLGEGLVTSEGETWRRHRVIIQPVFHPTMMADFVNQFNEISKKYIQKWSDKVNINNFSEMSSLTASIVTKTILGSDVEFNAQELGEAVSFLTLHIQKRVQTLIAVPHSVPTKENRSFKKQMEVIDTIVNNIIEEHKQSTKDRTDILSKMFKARDPETGEGLTDDELRNEIRTFFLAGHETTATSLTWAHYALALNPEVRQKMIDEIHSVLGYDRDPTYEDLSKMEYLEQVANEVMRLYPPIYMFARNALAEDNIDGYSVPKGMNVIMSQYTLHHDPLLWEEPEVFKPERFEKEKMKNMHKYAFFPFGGGPRTCIGKPFALLEMKIILAKMYQNHTFELQNTEKIYPTTHFTLRPSQDIMLQVKKQEQ